MRTASEFGSDVSVGQATWAIAEVTSHQAMCFVNAGERDAHIRVTSFLADRDSNAFLSTIAHPAD
jgi:hypothetical protein